ncbi:MAG TPA: hypothetical protein VIG88_06570 [Lysobacter sp.]
MKKTLITLAATALVFSGAAVAEVKIKGKNEQSTNVQGAVLNAAVGAGSRARQNISSNKGNVSIGGDNKQTTTVQGAVLNAAVGAGTKAEQNVSSNDGD